MFTGFSGGRWVMVFAAVYSGTRAIGQQLLIDPDLLRGQDAQDWMGRVVREVGDVNADGIPDFAASTFRYGTDDPGKPDYVRVYSGRDGSVLQQVNGFIAAELFGYSLDGIGDANEDGHCDWIVGAPGGVFNGPESGFACVVSGLDASILYFITGDQPRMRMGGRCSAAGDVDRDGASDFMIAYWEPRAWGGVWPEVDILSGRTGDSLHELSGEEAADLFGYALDVVSDLDGDGVDDHLVGCPGNTVYSEPGMVSVFSGADGTLLWRWYGDEDGDLFGYSAANAGDVDADGFCDVIVGANQTPTCGLHDDVPSPLPGYVKVFSGRDGSVLNHWVGEFAGDNFGWSVNAAGDANGDRHGDLLVGVPHFDIEKETRRQSGVFGDNTGKVYLYSGKTGMLLYDWTGTRAEGSHFGWSVSTAKDLNEDGFSDVLAGYNHDVTDPARTGSVRVFGGNDLFLNAIPSVWIAEQKFSLISGEGIPGNLVLVAIVAVNDRATFIPYQWATLDSFGRARIEGSVPTIPVMQTVTFQAFTTHSQGQVIDSAEERVVLDE